MTVKSLPKPAESDRNTDGLPKGMEPETEYPGNWAQINNSAPAAGANPPIAPTTNHIDQSNSNNRNASLPYLIGAWVTAAVALTLCIVGYAIGPRLIRAEMRAEFSQDIADARAESKAAGTDAAIWKNRVMKLEAEVNANRR